MYGCGGSYQKHILPGTGHTHDLNFWTASICLKRLTQRFLSREHLLGEGITDDRDARRRGIVELRKFPALHQVHAERAEIFRLDGIAEDDFTF